MQQLRGYCWQIQRKVGTVYSQHTNDIRRLAVPNADWCQLKLKPLSLLQNYALLYSSTIVALPHPAFGYAKVPLPLLRGGVRGEVKST